MPAADAEEGSNGDCSVPLWEICVERLARFAKADVNTVR